MQESQPQNGRGSGIKWIILLFSWRCCWCRVPSRSYQAPVTSGTSNILTTYWPRCLKTAMTRSVILTCWLTLIWNLFITQCPYNLVVVVCALFCMLAVYLKLAVCQQVFLAVTWLIWAHRHECSFLDCSIWPVHVHLRVTIACRDPPDVLLFVRIEDKDMHIMI